MSKSTTNQQDAAWVNVETPLTPTQLFEFILDAQRLLRLNPYLEIHTWQAPQRTVAEGARIHLKYLNEMNGVACELHVTVSEFKSGVGYTLNYSEGLKRATEIRIEPHDRHATLVITDHYHSPPEQADGDPLAEVDRSLTPWGVAIRQHFIKLARWDWLPFYRSLRERFWLGMAPRNRRISRMIVWITLLEFFAFLFVFLIYWIEYRR